MNQSQWDHRQHDKRVTCEGEISARQRASFHHECHMSQTPALYWRCEAAYTLTCCVLLSRHAVASPHWVSIGLLLHCPNHSQSSWGDVTAASIQTQWGDATTQWGSTTLVAASLGVCSQPHIEFLTAERHVGGRRVLRREGRGARGAGRAARRRAVRPNGARHAHAARGVAPRRADCGHR